MRELPRGTSGSEPPVWGDGPAGLAQWVLQRALLPLSSEPVQVSGMDRPFQQPQDELRDAPHPRAAKEMWQDQPQTPRPPGPQTHPLAGWRVRRSAHLPSAPLPCPLLHPGLPPLLCPVAQCPARLARGGRALVRPCSVPPLRAPGPHRTLHPRAHCGVALDSRLLREPWSLCVRGLSQWRW